MSKGKKWTEGQDIGAQGESVFRAFAHRLGLIPQRIEQDVGIDFFCQPVVGSGAVRAVSGHVVGACVRTTRGKSGRIGLSANDAGQLLASTFPVLIVLVHLHKKQQSVFARLLDDELGVRLARAIRERQRSISLKPSDLKGEGDLANDLQDLNGAAERTRVRMVSRLIRDVVPSARLQVRRDQSGQLTIVEVRSLFDSFDVSSEAGLQGLHAAVFGAPSMLGGRLSELPLKHQLVSSLEYLSGPVIVGGGVEAPPENVTVSSPSGTATEKFHVRSAPRKFGYVHDCGLSLTLSERFLHEGRWVHRFESDIDATVEMELDDFDAFWSFLEKCTPDAKISLGTLGPYDIERFPALIGAGYFARYLRLIREADAVPRRVFFLKDALSEEALQTMRWVSELARDKNYLKGFGFQVIDETLRATDPEGVEVPIVANTPRGSIVTWLAASVRFLDMDDEHAGLVIEQVDAFRHDIRNERFEKRTVYPEVVVAPGMPALQFSGGLQTATLDVAGWGLELKARKLAVDADATAMPRTS